MIDAPDLEAIADNDEHAAWIVEHHIGGERYGTRQRCAACDEWWPCGLVGLAALAILRAREAERLRAVLREIARTATQSGDTAFGGRLCHQIEQMARDALAELAPRVARGWQGGDDAR